MQLFRAERSERPESSAEVEHRLDSEFAGACPRESGERLRNDNFRGARCLPRTRKGSFRFAAGLLVLSLSVIAQAADPDDARAWQNYVLNCQGCHLADGSGSPGAVPNLRNFLGYFLHVSGGREYIVRVPGSANSALDDEQLAAVLNWILMNFSREQLPADFLPYSADEVGTLRKEAFADVGPIRAELVRKIRGLGKSE